MNPPRNTTILVVEDDPGIAQLEKQRLTEAGHEVLLASTAAEALAYLHQRPVDLLLLDYRLPGDENGLEFYARVKAMGFDTPVILVTGFGGESTVIQALRLGVRDFIVKSIEYLEFLPDAVARVLKQVTMEHQLAESEARLGAVIGSAQDAVIVTEADHQVSLFNPAAERMFQCPAAEALGRRITDFMPDALEPLHEAAARDEAARLSRRPQVGAQGVRASGERFPLEATVSQGEANGQRFQTVVVRDITQRVRAEEALRESGEWFRALVEASSQAVWTANARGAVVEDSPSWRAFTGQTLEEFKGEGWAAAVHPDDRADTVAAWRRAVANHCKLETEVRIRHVGGQWRWTAVRAVPLRIADGDVRGWIAMTTDITERRRAEEQFRQAQKMEVFGRLVAGIAHDFNNLLTVINGCSELALSGSPILNPARELVSEINKAGDRAAGLTRQLLAFTRQQVLEPRVLNLNAVIQEVSQMLRRLIGEDLDVQIDLSPALGMVKVDPGQIEQVLTNLAVNARDAMPQHGRLTIATANVELDAEDSRSHPEVLPGRYVQLAVSDTGCGMTEEVKRQIFEPFFTTKEVGRGTGLGLATVFGIVKQSGGQIAVDSEAGKGTTFKIYLPCVDEKPIRDNQSCRDASTAARGPETILLVEDEPAVRALTRFALRSRGYTVLEAADGAEALRLMQSHQGPIHLLLSDVVMPQMGGRELAKRVTALRPQVRVLFLSGYTPDAVVRNGILEAEVAFLQKPFTVTSLTRKVRMVLDGETLPASKLLPESLASNSIK